jgi:hypothetical protein
MKATISGVNEWSNVRLIPETEQELMRLQELAEGAFNNVGEYVVHTKLTVIFSIPNRGKGLL